jgi:hypothetical protein
MPARTRRWFLTTTATLAALLVPLGAAAETVHALMWDPDRRRWPHRPNSEHQVTYHSTTDLTALPPNDRRLRDDDEWWALVELAEGEPQPIPIA